MLQNFHVQARNKKWCKCIQTLDDYLLLHYTFLLSSLEFNKWYSTTKMCSSVSPHGTKQIQWETWRKPSEQPAFYCMFRMLTSVVATDYNRVVCIRQTRNDEEVTDWWKWWAIIFLYKKNRKKKNRKKKLQSTSSKKKEKKRKRKKSCCRMRAPWQLLGCPPLLSPPLSLPPPPSGKKPKCGVREGERGGRNDSGLDGRWWMKQWRFSSGASVWCWGIWCHTAAACRTLVSGSV